MDLQQEIKSFGPIDLESLDQSNGKPDKDVNSIIMYNKAIEYLKAGNDDIAMIELKKVVSANPNFYQAVNLLGLCYAYTKQLDKAEELFQSIVQREDDAIKAADYLNFISISDNASSKKTTKSKPKQIEQPTKKLINEPVKQIQTSKNIATENILLDKINSNILKPRAVVIVNALSVICLIIAIILFVGASKGSKETNSTDVAGSTAIGQQANKVSNSLAELKDLKAQLEEANSKLKQYTLATQVSQASNLYAQKKYLEAADKIKSINVDELPDDLKENYNSTKDKVYLSLANQLLSEGNAMYKSRDYQGAVTKLEKLFTLGDKFDFADKALYILGKSYVEVNDIPKATATYEKLINEHPNSSYVKYAKSRLKSIQ